MVGSAPHKTNHQETDCYQKKAIPTENLLPQNGVVRKYMNGAVYIESTINATILKGHPNNEDPNITVDITNNEKPKIKHCSCTLHRYCAIHEKNSKNLRINHFNAEPVVEQLQLSMLSLATVGSSGEDDKEDVFQSWVARKNKEKKILEENKIYLKEAEETGKQKRLDQERENFKRWLANKKKQDEKRKVDNEKKLNYEKAKGEQKERRNLECKLRYLLWAKKKEEEELEKKIKDQMAVIKNSDDKQKRIEENEKAFKCWLDSSKNKPKPIPPSLGLESLRSSVSVTYINPVPWTPNIEDQPKPTSQ